MALHGVDIYIKWVIIYQRDNTVLEDFMLSVIVLIGRHLHKLTGLRKQQMEYTIDKYKDIRSQINNRYEYKLSQ